LGKGEGEDKEGIGKCVWGIHAVIENRGELLCPLEFAMAGGQALSALSTPLMLANSLVSQRHPSIKHSACRLRGENSSSPCLAPWQTRL
jgi:hypothetical protein